MDWEIAEAGAPMPRTAGPQRPQTGTRRVIALVNAKGGTGKTTCSVNLAAALGEAGERVLLLDLDPQGSASDALGVPHDPEPGGDLRDVLAGDAPARRLLELAVATSAMNVSLVPASPRMETLSVDNTLSPARSRRPHLRDAIDALPQGRGGWTVVLIDTPPTIGALSLAALASATEAMIPVMPSPAALPGLRTARGAVQRVRETVNSDLRFLGVVACRMPETVLGGEVLAQLRKSLKRRMFSTVIRESVRVEEAHGWGLPVLVHDPQGDAACDFRALAAEVADRGPGREE